MRVTILAVLVAPSIAIAAPAKEDLGTPSRAVNNAVIDAIAEEMDRNLKNLEINGIKPYHLAYKITEVDVNDVAATLGHTTSRRNRHFVNLEVRVRIGSEALDNTNFVVPQAEDLDAVAGSNLPLDATPDAARRVAWRMTDTAFKEAFIQYRAKLEARRSGAVRGDVPSFSALPPPLDKNGKPVAGEKGRPAVSEEPVLVPVLESLDDLEARAKKLSAVFRDQADLRDSRVAVTSYLERRWYLTSDGTSTTDTRRASGVLLVATGQAPDGQPLGNYFLRYGHTAKDLPSDDELRAEAKKLGETITALAKAPLLDRYSGPVLFQGEGAVGLARFTLAPHLGGTPVPDGLSPQEAKTFGGALTDKIGLRALSPVLSIVDDPTAKKGGGKALIGGYKFDDEGVRAERVQVVQDGWLRTLLTSRTPSQKDQVSNGHARRTAAGGAFHGSATNLFIMGKGGVSRAALEQRLIAAARAEGLKYGLLIQRLDDAAVTATPEFSRRELIQMLRTMDPQLPPPAVLAYRVYPNGKRELVRGAQLPAVLATEPTLAWKNVLGVSKDTTAYNFLAATENQLSLRLTGGTDEGFVPSAGIESSVVTPDVLIKDLGIGGSRIEIGAPVVPKPGS